MEHQYTLTYSFHLEACHFLSPLLCFSLSGSMDVGELKMLPAGESDGSKVCVKVPGPTLTYQNIQYCIRESRGPCRKRGPEREILKTVRLVSVCVYVL